MSSSKPHTNYKATAGIASLINTLKDKIRWKSIDSLRDLRKRLKEEMQERETKKQSYTWACNQVEAREKEIRKTQHEIAEIVSDLGRLGCPEAEIQKAIKECEETFTAHELATWLEEE